MSDVEMHIIDMDEFLRRLDIMSSEFGDVLEQIAKDLGKLALRLYKGTVRTWTRKPNFTVLTEARGDQITVMVGTDSDIYKYVDKGTAMRDIVPRNKPVLVFRRIYKPRTTPGKLQSGRKWSGGGLIFTRRVRDHSIKPRNLTVMGFTRIDREAQPLTMRYLKKWHRRVTSGHGTGTSIPEMRIV